jgi:hypothetical protein
MRKLEYKPMELGLLASVEGAFVPDGAPIGV